MAKTKNTKKTVLDNLQQRRIVSKERKAKKRARRAALKALIDAKVAETR